MKKPYKRSNYKSNLEKLPSLLVVTCKDPDDEGFHIDISKICKKLDITPRTLNRYLHQLENDGILEIASDVYDPNKHSKRWKFTDDNIPNNDDIIDSLITLDDYNNSNLNNHYFTHVDTTESSTDIFNVDTTEKRLLSPKEKLLDEIERMTNEVNKWSPIKLKNTCRYIKWTTGKVKIRHHKDFKGRVLSSLCLTKSGKKPLYSKHDHRLYRNDYLKSINLGHYSEIYDIKSEVPRVSDYLSGSNDFYHIPDYYTHFLTQTGFNNGLEINGQKIYMNRDDVKGLFMRCYFSKSLDESYRHYCFGRKNGYSKEAFSILWNEVRKVNPIGKEIFLWTSLIELYTLDEIYKTTGEKVLNVYDCFYGSATLKSDFIQGVIEKSAEKARMLKLRCDNSINNNDNTIDNCNNHNNNINNYYFTHVDTTELSNDLFNVVTTDIYNVDTTKTKTMTRSSEMRTKYENWIKSVENCVEPEAIWTFEEFVQLLEEQQI